MVGQRPHLRLDLLEPVLDWPDTAAGRTETLEMPVQVAWQGMIDDDRKTLRQ